MRYATITALCLFFITTTLMSGAGAQEPVTTGFLTDYSRLKPGEGTEEERFLHVNRERLAQYNKFIVDPVFFYPYAKSKAHKRFTPEELAALQVYMHAQMVQALTEGGYALATEPGPGVGLLRMALTDIVPAKAYLNLLPPTRLIGAGLGGAAMEAELLDSQSGEQIAATIDNRRAGRIGEGSGMTKMDMGRAVIRRWAASFVTLLDLAKRR